MPAKCAHGDANRTPEGRCRECRDIPGRREHKRTLARTDAYKEKARERWYIAQYGITLAQYNAILSAQGGKCVLCKRKSRGTKRLAVHHDHDTGEVVAILCMHHNRTLPYYGDSPEGLRAAADKLDAALAVTRALLAPDDKGQRRETDEHEHNDH